MTYTKLLTQKKTSHKIVIQGKSMNIQHVIDLLNRAELYDESSAVQEIVQQNKDMLEALKDMRNGWRYIRETYGDLYGVGWDRAEDKANAAITRAATAIQLSKEGK